MRKKEQMFWLASRSRMWRIPLCMVAFSLLPSAYSFASAENPAAETVWAVNSVQQQRTVKGIVIDANGEAVIGANVKEPGSTTGTITDINGEFSLSVGPKATLEVSFIGYTTQKVNVGASNTVKVILKEDTKVLDEVVITGFGMSQKKATLTGAVAAIASTDIERSNATTASGALVGKIAGINTRQNDGRPGASTQLQIRNMGAPLYVIDGVVSDDGQFNNMDFNDIESISILKDASAAIYGVRAANGVVVVTSKKGHRNSKNSVSVNAYYGWQHNSRYVQPAKTKDYVTAYVSAETWAKKADNDRRYNKEEYAKWMAGTEKNYQGFDWSDYIWITAPQSYISANLSGGTDKANYYVAVSHIDQEATVRGYGGFRRTNAQMNIDMNISDRFKIGATMNGRIEDRHHPGVPGSDDTWLPRFATMKNQPTKRPYANDNPLYPQLVSDQKETNFALLNYETSGKVSDVWRVLQMQTTAEYEILKGLKAKGMLGYYYAYNELDNQEYTFKLYGYNEKTGEYYETASMDNPYRERNREKVEDQFANFQLNFDRRFGNHSINAVASFEATQRKRPKSWVHSVPVANGMDLIRFKEIVEYNDTGNNTEARMGWLGRINYSFADRYLIELIGRWDGSWKFKPENRWGFFPSASLGWRISEENFWKESKIANVFSNLKIRGSYGVVGDDNVSDYAAFDYLPGYKYNNGGAVLDGDWVVGTETRGLPNKTLSWMESKILDIGVDMGFFNNRLNAQVDFFQRIRDGIPESRYDVLIPNEAGFSLPKENLKSDKHVGFDAMVSWADHINDFNYSVGANMTYSRFWDWEQYDTRHSNSWDVYRNSIWHRVGYVNWGYEAVGRFTSWEQIATYPIDNDRKGNKTVVPGDIMYKDVNGDGVINYMDERPIGYRSDSTPTLNFGINLAASWKGFDLAMDWTGSGMTSWQQQYETARPFQNDGNSPEEVFKDAWHLADIWDADSQLIPGKYPLIRLNNEETSAYDKSTFWLHNVKYIKLRNLEFGYTLPKRIVAKAGISNLRLYVSGTNLFSISNIPFMDPECIDSNGLDYPTMRVVNLGINLKF
ncbi:TonB-dependent receptor [Bacteroides fragilis]|nr:TonB-dependent receptor [Bacteroides fragilis]MCS2659366.1 TonB-dependent receptor [Bacteroides fragilis]UVS00968.1 TonB-dependent receptor [Bacteroides fragilis]